ncbi:hypothetical protein EYV94_03535 [Puteibacter caeruleilacunae]|nr:hypothetical protein EYV94_03535 [Puteibacter caeruleilacunae]
MKYTHSQTLFVLVFSLFLFACNTDKSNNVLNDGWPSYMHDQHNSGISKVSLKYPLKLGWKRQLLNAPNPAWPAPAKQDYFNGKGKLEPLVTYDRAFHPIVANGLLYIASSANNSIICFDIDKGKKIWQFFTDAPNRNAPLWHDGALYVGSDDGKLYCLDPKTGRQMWKKAFGNTRKLIGNGRIISSVPIRTGVVAKGDTLFVAIGLLPEENVEVHACSSRSGNIIWTKKLKDLAPQGYPVLSDSTWYVPNSRVQPMAFDLNDGTVNEKVKGLGGDYVTLINDKLVHGVNWQGEIKAQNFLEAAMTGYKVIGEQNQFFIATEFSLNAVDVTQYAKAFAQKAAVNGELKQLAKDIKAGKDVALTKVDSLKSVLNDIKKEEFLWQAPTSKIYCMVKSAESIIIGQQDQVTAYDVTNGETLWKQDVDGRAYGLAMSEGKLFVSTDKGVIYCFGDKERAKEVVEEPSNKYFTSALNHSENIAWARKVKSYMPREKGIVLLPNSGKGDRVFALTHECDYYVIGIEDDERQVEMSRVHLDEAGIYGGRTTIFQGAIGALNFSDYLVNVVILDQKTDLHSLEGACSEISRILSPSGGRLLIGADVPEKTVNQLHDKYFKGYALFNGGDYWIIEREALPGSGEWTHLYANESNTVSTGDQYASDKVKPLWFGQPGPRDMSDRHHRAPAPLFKNGILYIPKDDGVLAADAYNGTLLWDKDIAHFRRIKISRDAGNLALNNKALYAVADNFCYVLDPITGQEKQLFRVPLLKRYSTDPHWGYVAVQREMLFGSARKSSAIFNQYSRLDWSEHSRLVTSDYLFGMNQETGKTAWTYKGGVILNPSICMGDGKMFFVESMNPEALNDEDGLIPFNVLKKKMNVVALDSSTGKVIWKEAFDFKLIEHILFGSYADGVLVMSGSGNKNKALWYGTYGFDSKSGDPLWRQEKQHLSWTNGSHGEQIHRAMIMNGTVYTEPFAYDLQSGKQKEDWKLTRNGHSCGNISGADDVIYFRGTNPSVCIPGKDDQGTKLNNISRPGCWINMIPAGGVVLIPEASSGCTCNFPLQMSIVYQPISSLK